VYRWPGNSPVVLVDPSGRQGYRGPRRRPEPVETPTATVARRYGPGRFHRPHPPEPQEEEPVAGDGGAARDMPTPVTPSAAAALAAPAAGGAQDSCAGETAEGIPVTCVSRRRHVPRFWTPEGCDLSPCLYGDWKDRYCWLFYEIRPPHRPKYLPPIQIRQRGRCQFYPVIQRKPCSWILRDYEQLWGDPELGYRCRCKYACVRNGETKKRRTIETGFSPGQFSGVSTCYEFCRMFIPEPRHHHPGPPPKIGPA